MVYESSSYFELAVLAVAWFMCKYKLYILVSKRFVRSTSHPILPILQFYRKRFSFSVVAIIDYGMVCY